MGLESEGKNINWDLVFTTVEQVGVMFLLVLVGFVCYKLKIVSEKGSKELSDLVFKVVNPMYIFISYQSDYSSKLADGLLKALMLTTVFYVINIAVAYTAIKKDNIGDSAIMRFAVVYSNCGFMGIPLVGALFGATGVIYLTSFIAVFNILLWTHGYMIMKEEKGIKSLLNALKSPAIIAIVLGLFCFFFRIKMPSVIYRPIELVGNMTTPLAMMVAGITIAQTDMKKALKNAKVYFATALRLLVVPILFILVIFMLPIDKTVMYTVIVAGACPTAASGTLFAVKFGRNAKFASEIFAVTTVLSAITLPTMIFLAELLIK